MLEIRPCCEHCGKDLSNTTTEAMICTFECTFCYSCASEIFENVCPNCGGNFEKRPVRPSKFKDKYPSGSQRLHEPKDLSEAKFLTEKFKNIPPENR